MAQDPKLDRRFPAVADMRSAAARRVPRFAWDYLEGGIGDETGLDRNRSTLKEIQLMPQYLGPSAAEPDMSCHVLGKPRTSPIGIAPMGLSGLVWPGALSAFAKAAQQHDVPLGVSNSANESLEDIAEFGAETWFQFYVRNDESLEADLLNRARATGCDVLVITIDIPGPTRRARDIRNAMIFPIRLTARHLAQIALRPHWALATLRCGTPRFRTFDPYVSGKPTLRSTAQVMAETQAPMVTPEKLAKLRRLWSGQLLVKGVLSTSDAKIALEAGADGLVISNHGGRQLDAAPDVPSCLQKLRADLGPNVCLIADSGVRSGLDIARMIACGANFVLLGRAMAYAVAAMGPSGPAHALEILKQELVETLRQTGCQRLTDLPERLL